MTLAVREVEALLRELLPTGGEDYELRLARDAPGDPVVTEQDGASIRVRLELVIYEPGTEPRAVRDVKQQQFDLLSPSHRADARRAEAYLRAWARALPAAVAALDWELDCLMPTDLVFPQALGDAALQTEDDFAAALGDAARVRSWIEADERAELREGLSRWDLGDKLDEFRALLRPAIELGDNERVFAAGELEPDSDETTGPSPVGATRLGGEPDLPPELAWPTSGGRPMTFVAQLDLASLRGFAAARELPDDGLLSFFYDATPDSNFETTIEYPTRVLHIASRDRLARRATPPGGERRPEFAVEPRALDHTMPPIESPFYEALLPVEKAMAFRRSLTDAAAGTGHVIDPLKGLPEFVWRWTEHDGVPETHRVLGYCRPYQGDPYVSAEVYATGRGWRGWEEGSPTAIAVARAARRWRLLLQVCAMIDGELLLNQDAGDLFFMIPDDALAARDWSRVFCVLQCS